MSNLIRAVRLASENAPDAPAQSEIARATEDYITECSYTPDFDKLILGLEAELQAVHRDVVDYSSLRQLEVFLVVLSQLKPHLTLTSMFYWWDIILRPALREPKLGTVAVNHAKELVLATMRKTEENSIQKVRDFRRRLFDLYLLDAHNELSGDDVLEHAELDVDQRDRRTCWKGNLDDILLRFGSEYPQEFMTEVHDLFAVPSSRLQLFMLLNTYSSSPSFTTSVAILAKHPLMTRLLTSMLLDNSSTLCSTGSTVLVKMLPALAIHGREELRALLPMLMAVLAKLMCWKERFPTSQPGAAGTEVEREQEDEANLIFLPHPNMNWQCLEMTFNITASNAPSPRPCFTILYYLYPANMIRFLRNPVRYLRGSGFPSPWTEDWEKALNQGEIRVRSERLLREHLCHPALIWQEVDLQLEEVEFWSQFPVERIATEAIMLDMRNNPFVISQRLTKPDLPETSPPLSIAENTGADEPAYRGASSYPSLTSLQEMVNASVTLKSSLNLDVEKPVDKWSQPSSLPLSKGSTKSPSPPAGRGDDVPLLYLQAVARLQREVLLLRNELNFEMWLSRENAKHIGRLSLDHSIVKSAEVERQGLYNKLRKYRTQVVHLENELHEYKVQASSTKNKYAEWNMELQKKLKELREEKKSWMSESAALRRAQTDSKALLDAQEKLLEEANQKIFTSETWKKENQHKIDRLHDYEQQINQHIKMQQLWDQDFSRFNERGEQVSLMQSHFKQMELRLESYQSSQVEMDAQIRAYRRQIQTLEARLSQMRRKTESLRHPLEQEIGSIAAERATLTKANQRLRDENSRLREEVEELRAVVEVHVDNRAE